MERMNAASKLSRVLRNDPGLGIIRHADAGYDVAKDYARKYGLDINAKVILKRYFLNNLEFQIILSHFYKHLSK